MAEPNSVFEIAIPPSAMACNRRVEHSHRFHLVPAEVIAASAPETPGIYSGARSRGYSAQDERRGISFQTTVQRPQPDSL
jgi:hypothetical protein